MNVYIQISGYQTIFNGYFHQKTFVLTFIIFTRKLKNIQIIPIHMKTIIILALFVALSFSLFNQNSAVVKLTQKNFKQKVLQSDQLWLVQFYAPWCGHCKSSAPQFEKAAQILKGIVNVGAVDMTTDSGAGRPYDVQGYPTIKFFGSNKNKPQSYESGARTFQNFVQYSMKELKSQIKNRRNKINQHQQL